MKKYLQLSRTNVILLLTFWILGATSYCEDWASEFSGRGGGYVIGNAILWQDGTTSLKIRDAVISNNGQTLYQVRNYILEPSQSAVSTVRANP